MFGFRGLCIRLTISSTGIPAFLSLSSINGVTLSDPATIPIAPYSLAFSNI